MFPWSFQFPQAPVVAAVADCDPGVPEALPVSHDAPMAHPRVHRRPDRAPLIVTCHFSPITP